MKFIIPLLALLIIQGGTRAQAQALAFNDVTRWGNWRGAISSFDLQVTVEGLISRNILTLDFKDFESNQSDSLELTYGFSLPQGSVVDSLYLWVGDEKVPGAMKSIWTAWQIYGSIVRRRWDPALLTTSGNGYYQLRVFPFARRQERRVQICYTTPLQPAFDRLRLEIPLQLTLPSAQPVARIRVDVLIPGIGKDRIELASIDSAAWEKSESGGETRIAYRASDRIAKAASYILIDHPTFGRDGMAVHFDVDAGGETHFMAVMNPRKALDLQERKRKRKVLVLWNLTTTSLNSVWDGERYRIQGLVRGYYPYGAVDQEAKEIVDFLRASLSPGDELNFMFNDLKVKSLRSGLAPVDAGTLASLGSFLEQSLDRTYRSSVPDDQADGPEDLVAKGLASLEGTDSAELILIDRYSQPYWWDTTYADPVDVAGIMATVPKGLTAFVVANTGLGSIGSKPTGLALVYQDLARKTQGALISGGSQYYPIAPILEGLKPFFSLRIYPASLSFSAGNTGFAYDVFGIPSLFYLDQSVVVLGKLSLPAAAPLPGAQPEAMTVRLLGKADGQDLALSKEFQVIRSTATSRLSKLWGARKVESILANGYYSPRLWEEATDWSLHYRILTPVTALLALEPGRFDSTWYQDQKPSDNPNLPSRLGEDARKRLEPGRLSLSQEPGFLVIDLSGFDPAKAGFTLQVFDGRGRLVADLTTEARKGGKSLRWATQPLRKGAYVLRLRAGGKSLSKAFTIR